MEVNMNKNFRFVQLTQELLIYIQRTQGTIMCVTKGDQKVDLQVTDEELQALKEALAIIKDVRERVFNSIKATNKAYD